MTIQTYTPSAELASFIDAYAVIECSEDALNRVFPGTSLVQLSGIKGMSATQQKEREKGTGSVCRHRLT